MVSSEFAVGQRSVFASTLLSARVSALAGAPPPHAKLVCPTAQCLYERLHLWKEQTPNPTPDKVKSLYNAQQQFLVVQGQDKDLGTASPLGFGDSVVLSSSEARMILPVSAFLSSSSALLDSGP